MFLLSAHAAMSINLFQLFCQHGVQSSNLKPWLITPQPANLRSSETLYSYKNVRKVGTNHIRLSCSWWMSLSTGMFHSLLPSQKWCIFRHFVNLQRTPIVKNMSTCSWRSTFLRSSMPTPSHLSIIIKCSWRSSLADSGAFD